MYTTHHVLGWWGSVRARELKTQRLKGSGVLEGHVLSYHWSTMLLPHWLLHARLHAKPSTGKVQTKKIGQVTTTSNYKHKETLL